MAQSHCPSCGASAPEGSSICEFCSGAIPASSPPASPPPSQPPPASALPAINTQFEVIGETSPTECPWCKTPATPGQEKCGECGTALIEDTTLKQLCVHCGERVTYTEEQIGLLIKCPACTKPMKLRVKREIPPPEPPEREEPARGNDSSSGGFSIDIGDFF